MARLHKVLVILSLALGLAVVAGVIWRQALVETAARRVLAANGLDAARLEVVEVSTNAIVIRNLALGPGLPEARRVRLDYAPGELFSGRLRNLRIEGLRYAAPADLGAALEPFGPLMPGGGEAAGGQAAGGQAAGGQAAGGQGAGGNWFTLPRIEIADGLVTLAAPVAGTISVDGALDLSGDRPGATLDVAFELGAATGAFKLRSDALGEGGIVAVDGGGEAQLAGVALPVQPSATITGGHARYSLAGAVRIPPLESALTALHGENLAALSGDLALADVTSSASPGTLAADIGWTLQAGDGVLRLELSRPARLSVARIPPETLNALGLATPEDAPQDLTAEIAESGPLVAWKPGPDGGAADLAADLSLTLGEATVDAKTTARLQHDVAYRLSGPVTGSAEVEATGIAITAAKFAASVKEAAWSVSGSLEPDGGVTLQGPMRANLADLRTAAFRAAVLGAEGAVTLSGHRGQWALGAAPGLSLSAEGATVPGHLALSGPLGVSVEALDLEGGDSAIRLDLQGHADPASGALLSGDEEVMPFADASGGFGITASFGQQVEGEITLGDAAVTLPSHGLAVAGLSGRIPLGSGEAPLALAGRLSDTGRTARFPPLEVTLEGQRNGDALAFSGAAEALGGVVRLPLTGSADLAKAAGRLSVGPTRLGFRKDGLQPSALSALLPPHNAVDGAVRASADFTFDTQNGVRSAATLDFEDFSAWSGALGVTGLAGRLRLARLAPLATAGPQELTARHLTAGVPLDGVRLRISAEARGRGIRLRIPEASGALAGGTVLVEDALWDTGADSNAVDVRVRDVDLSRLLTDWHIQGISGSGRLSGVIPVRLAPAGVAVAGGRVEAAGPGVVRVDWGSARETLMNSGDQVALTVRALEDFHYVRLEIGVDQPPDGELNLAVTLEGANPEVLDGHPFRFNITLGGELAPILEAVRQGQRIGTELLRGGIGAQ